MIYNTILNPYINQMQPLKIDCAMVTLTAWCYQGDEIQGEEKKVANCSTKGKRSACSQGHGLLHRERASPIVADVNKMGKGKGCGVLVQREERKGEMGCGFMK